MGLLQKLVGGAATAPIEAIGNVISRVYEGKNEKLSHEEIMTKLAMQPQLLQAEITKMEAQHRTMFVAGARPAILWVCAVGLAFVFVLNPVIQWVTGDPGPVLPTESLTGMVYALLGLGALRTVEKVSGAAK